MSNPPCVSSTLSIASPIRPLSPHEDRGDKAPQQQKAAPSTPSTWRRKQAVLVLVFVVVPLLLMSDGSAKNNNEKHSNKPGLSVSRVEGHGDTTPPPTPIQRSSHPSDSSIRIQSQGTPKSTRPPPVEEFTQRTAKPTINRKPRKKSPSIRFAMFPKASHCNCRYEEQPDARRHTFKEALSKFMYGRNDTTSSSPTTSVQQRRVLVVGDSVGRYLAAGIVNGVIEEGALDRDVLESLNLAAEQTKMKGGVATNLRRTRGTIAQWPPPEMLAKMNPAMVDKLPFRLQFEMDIFVSQDRNFTATRNMFDPTHIILARGNWDLDKMTPSNPRRYYNEFQGLLAAVRRAFPETHMFVYGFHKLIPDTTALNKHPHVRCTHRAEVGIFRDANYCAVKRYNGLLLNPGHRAVHYIDSFGITKGFRKSNQENKDGLHYIGAALAALAHSTVELMLVAQEQQVVGNPTSVVAMNATEVQLCTIAVTDEFHTSRMPCQMSQQALWESVQTSLELSQEVLFSANRVRRLAPGDASRKTLFPSVPALITAEDINAVRTKRTLSPAIKAVSLAAGSCSKLLVWLKEQFSGVQHLQRLVADVKQHAVEGALPWTLDAISNATALQLWLEKNKDNIILATQRKVKHKNDLQLTNLSVIDVAAQCVTMLHTHVTPAFFHEVLWPLSYGSGMVPCGAVRFLPFFQEWLSSSPSLTHFPRCAGRLPSFSEVDRHCNPGTIAWYNFKAFGAARDTIHSLLRQHDRVSMNATRRDALYLSHCPDLLTRVYESFLSNQTLAGLLPSMGAPHSYNESGGIFFTITEALDQFPVSELVEDDTEVLGTSVQRCLGFLSKFVESSETLVLAPANTKERAEQCDQLAQLRSIAPNVVKLGYGGDRQDGVAGAPQRLTDANLAALLKRVGCAS